MKMAEMVANDPQMLTEVNVLGVGQFRALTTFEKPVVEEYFKGGPLGDIPHDEVATMPRSELEAEARRLQKKVKEDRKAQDNAIYQKEKKINDLERELRYREPPTKEQLAQAKLDEIGKEFLKLLVEASDSMEQCKIRVLEAQRVEGVTPILLDNWQLRYNDYIEDLNKTREELGILIDELHPEAEGGLI
jgi:predicted ribosome quality control (RQC) complex YloA/Tae2 family protein